MYTQQSLQDLLFLMLYGGTAMLALMAGIYIGLRRNNAISSDINPPKVLRWFTSAFFITAALSHIWWYVLGVYWLTDDRLVRNILAVMLDHITLVPLVIAMLLRMLQDRQRPLWPWFLAQLPIFVTGVLGIVWRSEFYGFEITHYWQVTVITVFVIYYICTLIHYSRWLRENYADLEHKEVWQSLLFVVILFIIYEIYTTNPGEMTREYLAQANTIAIIAFLLWRVETLQLLDAKKEEKECVAKVQTESYAQNIPIPSNIGSLLQRYCEDSQLFLKHDLTLSQLSEIIGTNRTYLSAYFAQQGITYNTYINRLRINHFEEIYRARIDDLRSFSAQQLAIEAGFKSYSTFTTAFKLFKGQTYTSWIKEQASSL